MAGEGNRSRNKGRVGSREVVLLLRAHGVSVVPSLSSSEGLCDAVVAEGIHLEIKRQEILRIPLWIRQAEENALGAVPGVAFRQSRRPWYGLLPLEDLAKLLA